MAYAGIKCVAAPTQSDASHQISINLAKRLGATHYRYAYEIGWGDALPSVANMVRTAGMKMVLCVFRKDRIMPTTTITQTEFGLAINNLIAKAPDLITHVEIWNEPNHPPFVTTPNAAAFAGTVINSYKTIKAKYPAIKIITGGLSPESGTKQPDVFFKACIAADSAFISSFDMIGWHPYSFPSNPTGTQSWNPVYQARLLKSHLAVKYPGRTFEFAATEYGAPSKWSTQYAGTTVVFDEAKQAKWYKDYFVAFTTQGVAWTLVAPFTLRDQAAGSGGYTGTTWEPTVGLYCHDSPFVAKPAAAVYIAGV